MTLLGVLILGVFGKIAVRASDFDFLGKLVVELMLKGGDFVLELLFNFLGQVNHWML